MMLSPYRLRILAGEEEYKAGELLVERGGVRLSEQSAEQIKYTVAGEIRREITFSAAAPAQCGCDICREKGACRHLVAATLTARESGALDELFRRKAMAEITEAYFTICKSRKFIAELRQSL